MSSSGSSRPTAAGDAGPARRAWRSFHAAKVDYKGHELEEMDLDALLARRPQLALVDELAHTNAPGSRHPKRYLDVEELLERRHRRLHDGQHPARRKPERRRRPDHAHPGAGDGARFDHRRADDIELIDLTPDDLMQRLKEGKVYVPDQAERALNHYFSPGNLTALRELALRRTAQRVDEQLLTPYAGARDRAGPGRPASACSSASARIRKPPVSCATQSASQTGCTRPGRLSTSRRNEARSSRTSSATASPTPCAWPSDLAGGDRHHTRRARAASRTTCFAYAQANNVTQIVIGKSTRSRWFEILHGSVVHDLVRRRETSAFM